MHNHKIGTLSRAAMPHIPLGSTGKGDKKLLRASVHQLLIEK
jgi:hypothetical protein